MNNWTEIIGTITIAILAILGFIAIAAAVGLLMAFPVKWTWNATMPYLFSWPVLTWGKAWCLNFLCGVLFRSRITSPSKSEKDK